MLNVMKSKDRGHFNHGWLSTYHTFSFGQYYNPNQMEYGFLRVINEDIIKPKSGFPLHPHQNMEIITYVVSGTLTHSDSMGNEEQISEGMVQVMSAGSGIEHSEFNKDAVEPVHLFQIWIKPQHKNVAPRYDQKFFLKEDRMNQWCKIVSQNQSADSLRIAQDVNIYLSFVEEGKNISFENSFLRKIWIQVVSGSYWVNGEKIDKGDSIAIENKKQIDVVAAKEGELLLFDIKNNQIKH